MSTIVRTSTTRLGTRLVALAGATASVAALGIATAAPASAAASETTSVSMSEASADDCNRVLPSGTVNFNKRTWPVAGGLHMDTYDGKVSRSTGTVSGTTHLSNSYWGTGYHGALLVKLYNSCDELIGVTQPLKWGVDAKAWFWNRYERTEPHTQTLPSTITNRVARAEVQHYQVTGYSWIYQTLRGIACAVFQPACSLPTSY